jgi:hypothetical protein
MTDQLDCSCQDRQRSRSVCKHMRAVRLWMAAFATGAVAPKLLPGATSEDDRIALTPEGAAHLAGQSEQSSSSVDTDGSRADLAKLQADQTAHAAALERLGRDPEDDGGFLQRPSGLRSSKHCAAMLTQRTKSGALRFARRSQDTMVRASGLPDVVYCRAARQPVAAPTWLLTGQHPTRS